MERKMKRKMKRIRRIFAVLLTMMLCLQAMLPSVTADVNENVWVKHKLDLSGEDVRVDIDLCGSDGNLIDAETFDLLKPYYVIVTEDGKQLERKDIPNASFSVAYSGMGVFGIEFYNCNGEGLGHRTVSNGIEYFERESLWFDIQDTGVTDEDLTALGYRFIADAQFYESGMEITLKPIGNPTQTFAKMISLYKPAVYITWYDEEGGIIDEAEQFFKAESGDEAKITVNLKGAAGMICFAYSDETVDDAGFCGSMLEDGTFGEALFSLGTVPDYEEISFDDVPQDAWYAEYVSLAVDCGLVNGKGNGRFAPDDNMTYAEAITLAARMNMAKNEVEDPGTSQDGAWYQPYVDYAKEAGIPWKWQDYNAKVTREDYVHIFYAAMPAEEYTPINEINDGAVPDVSMNHKYAGEIYTFYRAGILAGSDSAHNFKPASNIKRSEVAAILCRMYLGMELQQFTLK